ncbi:MAG: hypothetical protein M0Q49_02265 [Porticoccaceae bacterium]|nr:hypothetical protein [Porticoccaceae bacterium]
MIIRRTRLTAVIERALSAIIVLAVLALVLLPLMARADGPYDLTATFQPPADGGPVEGYRLYQGCDNLAQKTLVGEVQSGQTLSGAIQVQGVHHFCVAAYNAAGEGAITDVARVEIDDFDPVPGAVQNLQIQVSCDASCNVTVNLQPAQ